MSFELITVNANVTVTVRLTKAGQEIVDQYYHKLNAMSKQYRMPACIGDSYNFLLWELMSIFGERVHNGAHFFVDNNITIMKPI